MKKLIDKNSFLLVQNKSKIKILAGMPSHEGKYWAEII